MPNIRDVDREVRSRQLLRHPFYTAWSRGEVPMPTLRSYAEQYYHFEVNFPRFVGATYAHLRSPTDRRLLLENLLDEEGRGRTHPELWRDFGQAIGARLGSRHPVPPTAATEGLLQVYQQCTLEGTATSGLGALYAYESQFPEIAAEKSRGLREEYGIRGRAAHEFFRVHTSADVEHSRAERELLRRHMTTSPAAALGAVRGTRASLAAWWRFLDSFSA